MGFCDASSLGAGGVWLDPSRSGRSLVRNHSWPPGIVNNLVSATNPEGQLTKSDLELAALNLHEATLLTAAPEARMAAPRSGSDNTPTILWSTCEASTINLVVADLLRIRALHSRQFYLNPSVFYHPGSRIARWLISLASSTYLTPPFSPTCLSPTHSRSVCDRYSPCRQNFFPA